MEEQAGPRLVHAIQCWCMHEPSLTLHSVVPMKILGTSGPMKISIWWAIVDRRGLLQPCSDSFWFLAGPNAEAAICSSGDEPEPRWERLFRPRCADVQEHGGSAREAGERGVLRAPDGHRRVQALPGTLRGPWHGHRSREGLRH